MVEEFKQIWSGPEWGQIQHCFLYMYIYQLATVITTFFRQLLSFFSENKYFMTFFLVLTN